MMRIDLGADPPLNQSTAAVILTSDGWLQVVETLDQEPTLDHRPKTTGRVPGRVEALLVSLAALASIAMVAHYLWLNRDHLLEARTPPHEIIAVPAADPPVSPSVKDLQAAQQRTTNEIDAINHNVAAIQADLKGISDQLSSLTTRLDALQNATPPAANSAVLQPGALADRIAATENMTLEELTALSFSVVDEMTAGIITSQQGDAILRAVRSRLKTIRQGQEQKQKTGR